MKKKDKNVPLEEMTAVQKLNMVLEQLDVWLHPRIIEAIKRSVWDWRTEMAKEYRDEKVAPELQQLEPLLQDYRRAVQDKRGFQKYAMRTLIKKIVELYGTQP